MTGYLLGTLVCTDLGRLTSGAAWPPHLQNTALQDPGGWGIWAHPGKGVAEASSPAEYRPAGSGRAGDVGSPRKRGG